MTLTSCPRHATPPIKQTWIRDDATETLRILSEEPIDAIFEAPEGARITVAYIGCPCINALTVVA